LWYALIGIVLGAVAIYVVSTFFVGDDPASQSDSTRRSATVEQSPGQSADVTSAPSVPSPGKPGSKKQAEPGLPASTRRQIPEPASRQNAPPDRRPGEDKRRTGPASTTSDSTPTAQPVSQPEVTRDSRQPPQVDTAAPASPESNPKPVQASATGERERPQPVLAAPQVSEPASTFASGPGFTDPARLVRIADLDEPLRLLESSHPETPAQATQAGVRGRVFLSVLVGDDGQVKDAKIMIEPGYGMGEMAKKAVQSWRYSKPKSRGESARVWKTEVIEFGGGGDQPSPENGGTEPNQAQSP
jgi:TonB family protein